MKKLIMLLIALMAFSAVFAVVINEGFEGATFPPADWTRVGTSWARSTTYPYTGVASARVGWSSGQYWLIAPKLRPAPGANTLTFWYRDHDSSSGWDYTNEYTYVKISTASNSTTDFTTTVWTGDYATFTLTYQQASIDLSAYNGMDIWVAFHHVATGGNYRYIDDFTGVDLAPAGPPNPAVISSPANAAVNVLQTATLNWTSGGGAPTGYKLQYGTNAAADNLMALTDIGNVFTYDPPGLLTYGQTYYWKVVPYNANGDATGCPTWSFTVMADPTITTFPYNQDFGITGAAFPPLNWNKYSGVLADPTVLGSPGTGNWIQDDWLNVTAPSNKAAKINIYGSTPGSNQGWLISPPIQMPGAGYQLEFDVAYMAWNGLSTPPGGDGTGDRFEVLIGDGTSWTPANIVRSWDNAGGPYSLNGINPAGQHVTLDISGYTGVKYVAFYAHNGAVGTRDNDLMVDNVLIRQTPLGAPDAVTLNTPADGATGLPISGFNLTWTPALTGGPVDYYAVYMSQDEETIYGDVYFETTLTSLNPTTYAGGPSSPVVFDWEERWYWTVEAVNGTGSAVVEPARWFEIMPDPSIVLPHTQNFDAATFPAGWSQAYSGGVTSNRWSISNTANAGGVAYEAMNTWVSGTGISRLISPPVNTTALSAFQVMFKHLFDDYGAGINAKLQYSHDLNTWYDTAWVISSGGGNVSGDVSVLISGISAPITYVAWTMDGNHYQHDYWYVDNVTMQQPMLDEVAPVSINMPQVVHPQLITPQATVINNGLNTQTFNVNMTIGAYSSTQQVVGLTAGQTQVVNFTPFTPAVFTANNVVVTTQLAGDQVPGNDVLNGVLICLDLDVQAFADVAYDPGAVNDGPATFNLQNPGAITDLPNANPFANFLAGADWMNGGWYGAEYAAAGGSPWWSIDPVSGAGTLLGTGTVVMSGYAYDDGNNIQYATNGTALYTVDGIGGETLIGNLHLEGELTWAGLMIGIAYDSFFDVMYGVDLGYDWLFEINPADGLCTPIGPLGIGLNYAQDCAFDRTNGLLYMAGYTSSGALYWIDTTSGAAYKVGDFQNGAEVTGFAIPYTSTALDAPVVEIAADGTVSWAAVPGAATYNVYGSADPYGTFTYLGTTASLSWLDGNFPEDKMFYHVTANSGTRAAVRQQVQGLNNLSTGSRSMNARSASAGLPPRK